MSKVIEIVNDRIMAQLEAGEIPWQKPWAGSRYGAISRSTGRPYSLINQMLLGKSGEYLTFKQIMEAGGKLLPDQKSSIVVFWKQVERKDTDGSGEDKKRTYPMLRYYRVFHIDQCEGIEPKYAPENLTEIAPDEEAERLCQSYLDRSGCTLQHAKQDRACYYPGADTIALPLREQFRTMEGYYSTKFHEIGHSTGHASRLNRYQTGDYKHEAYSREELVAELTAACMLNLLGLETSKTLKNSAAYIQSWLRALKNDTRMVLWAATRAEKAYRIISEDVEIAAVVREGDEMPTTDTEQPTETEPVTAPRALTPTMKKAAASFAKHCAKQMSSRPSVAGAFEHNGRQYITDGIILVAYDAPLSGLPQADVSDGNIGATLEEMLANARVGAVQALPGLQELRAQFKAAKAESKNKDFKQLTKLGADYFNSEFLVTAMALAGLDDGGKARRQKSFSPLFIAGTGCEVLIQAVRVKGQPANEVWRPTLSA